MHLMCVYFECKSPAFSYADCRQRLVRTVRLCWLFSQRRLRLKALASRLTERIKSTYEQRALSTMFYFSFVSLPFTRLEHYRHLLYSVGSAGNSLGITGWKDLFFTVKSCLKHFKIYQQNLDKCLALRCVKAIFSNSLNLSKMIYHQCSAIAIPVGGGNVPTLVCQPQETKKD